MNLQLTWKGISCRLCLLSSRTGTNTASLQSCCPTKLNGGEAFIGIATSNC